MIRFRSAELFRLELRARMPFRYGIATMTEVPQVFLRATFEIDGRVETGVAADLLPPKWFTKDPARALGDEIEDMLRAIRIAIRHAESVAAPTAFGFWRELYAAQAAWAAQADVPPLLAHFGTSFVERALVHAVCRWRRGGLTAALRENSLGIELGVVHPSLALSSPRDWLPEAPPKRVYARHTVGLADPITAADLAANDRVDDGLPQTLEDCLRVYGLRHFKIKINGEPARDRARLDQMTHLLSAATGDDYAFSLDGNESFRAVEAFADYFRELQALPSLQRLWSHLLYVEQPWHRDVALSPAIAALGRTWPDRPAIIIDESDAELASLPSALSLGYAGTSHKNCKGIFKGIANACLLAQRRADGQTAVLSGEDLANVGPISLIQDLAAQAALGVTSVERNGHHYFAGLAQFPAALQQHALAQHPDVFIRSDAGWPRVNVRDGQLDIASINAAPFGVPGEIPLRELPAIAV